MRTYQQIVGYCRENGIELLTSEDEYTCQSGVPSRKRIHIRHGCFHQCEGSIRAEDLSKKQSECRMCEGDGFEELTRLAEDDIRHGRITQEQYDIIGEDWGVLACLRYKSRVCEVSLSDMVDAWIECDQACHQCSARLFPTFSRKSFRVCVDDGYILFSCFTCE